MTSWVGSIPHSNDAIYDALVRLGQDFATRYPLIAPQGNFGTVDDPPAAMRYTEARGSPRWRCISSTGSTRETVDYEDNYSGERQEPSVLPARFPNLLVNGSTGIAVGMATNMAPHNLSEIVDAVLLRHRASRTRRPRISWSSSRGPDFPDGCIHRRAIGASRTHCSPVGAR